MKRTTAKKKRFNITVTDECWDKLGELAEGMGTSRSAFIELFVKQISNAGTKPIGDFVGGLFQEVLEIFQSGQGPGKRRP